MRHFMRREASGHCSRRVLDRSVASKNAAARRSGRRPGIEPLESRVQPSTITWTNAAGGDWDTASNWDLGRLPGPGDDVSIPALGSQITITHSAGSDTVASLTSSSNVALSGGTLTVTGNLSEAAGPAFLIQGGTLTGATVTAGSTLVGTPQGGTLSGVTVEGTMDLTQQQKSTVDVLGGLVLNGTALVGDAAGTTYGSVVFVDGGTMVGALSGTGTVLFGGWSGPIGNALLNNSRLTGAASTLTIGPQVTIRGKNGEINSETGLGTTSILNQGTISADVPGGTISIDPYPTPGKVTNSGTLKVAAGSTLELGDVFTLASLGTVENAGGTFEFGGILDLGGGDLPLNATTGSWTLTDGEIENGTISETGGARLIASDYGGTLSRVTVNGDLDLTEQTDSSLTVVGGMTLNGTMWVGNAAGTSRGSVIFQDDGTAVGALTGSGTIDFGGWNAESLYNTLVNMSQLTGASGTLTIGPGITIHGQNGQIINGPTNASIVNQGTINLDTAGGTIDFGDSAGSMSNSGTFNVTAGTTLQLGGLSLAGLGTINHSGGAIDLVGPFDLGGGTLALNASTGSWNLVQGIVKNGTIAESAGALLQFEGGALENVTVNGDMDVQELPHNHVGVIGRLVFNGTMTLGNAAGSTTGSLDFVDDGTGAGSLTGTGTIVFGGATGLGNLIVNDDDLQTQPLTLTIGPGINIRGRNGFIYNFYPNDTIVNQGNVSADVPGGTITLHGTSLPAGNGTYTTQGSVSALNGGTLVVSSSLAINGTNAFQVSSASTIEVSGDLLASSTSAAQFGPQGTVIFNGTGTAASPQKLEAMSQDLGASGFGQSFAFGKINVLGKTYVKLIDSSDNAPGTGAEAVYADSIVVAAGATLDLNGLHVYVRDEQIAGSVVGGTITLVPDGGPIALGAPTAGNLSSTGETDRWTFVGQPGAPTTIILDPGTGAPGGPVAPQLTWGQVLLLDPSGQTLASNTNGLAGALVDLKSINLPVAGTYTVVVQAAPGHSSSVGNYVLTAWSGAAPVAPQPSLNVLQTTGNFGGSGDITASLTYGSIPLAGESLTFSLLSGGSLVNLGTATTSTTGNAMLHGVSLAGFAAGTFPGVIEVSFPGDSVYAAAVGSGQLVLHPVTPTVTWPNPADITYGTTLGSSQLDASASVPGTFTYSPAAGAELHPGQGQTLSVTFTPTDTTDYTTVTAKAAINVLQAHPVVSWSDPADITYGNPLSATQLDATASVPGAFTYSQPVGTVLKAGSAQNLTVTFTPTDTAEYTIVTASVKINVLKATPPINWANPADIVAGTPLGTGQLDATSSVPGTFAYSPAAGALLESGEGQILSVTFNPTDANDYTSATVSVSINVLPPNQKFNPVIAWSNPAEIGYGTPLGPSQLDATASYGGQTVAGTFTYSTAAGTILNAGQAQTLSVTFVPDDTADYNNATASVVINVNPAPLSVTVADATKVYGQPNPAFTASYSGLQGSDTAGSLGPLTFTTTADSSSDVGSYDVTASGLTTGNYAITYVKGTLGITQATQTISWSAPADITYGTPLGAAQLDATAAGSGSAPAGALTYTPAAGTVLAAGNGQTLTVVAAATLDYAQATASVPINVAKATPTVTWTTPADIVYGTALGDGQLDATASVPGSFTYTPAAGTVLNAGPAQALSVTFTPTDTTDYLATTASTAINVTPAALTVTASDASRVYGQDNPAFDATYAGFVLGQGAGDLGGQLALSTTAAASSDVGGYSIVPAGLTSSNYAIVYANGTLTITPAPLTVTAKDVTVRRGAPLPTLTYTVSGFVNGDTSAVVTGTPSLGTKATSLSAPGTYPITVAVGSLAAKDYTFTNLVGGLLTMRPSSASGDYNGDGRTDYGFYDPNTATCVDVPANTAPIVLTHFGGPGWVATSGDYDGDGKTDVGLYNASSGTFVVLPSHGGPAIVINHFGGPGAEPLSGDYNGDGRSDFGFYDPNTATFVMVPSGGGPATVLTHFGGPGWVATSGDHDGDGKTDVGLYNASSGTFVVMPSHGGPTVVINHFGGPSAMPLGTPPVAIAASVKASSIQAQSVKTSWEPGRQARSFSAARRSVVLPSEQPSSSGSRWRRG